MANLTLSVGLVNVPVALTPLSSDTSLRGRMLCPEHMVPCKKGSMVCQEGHDVEETVTGYEVEGSFVLVDDRDSLRSERTKLIELEHTIEIESIDPLYFEKTYYVRPAKGGEPGHDLIAAVLREDGRALVGKAVLSKNTRALVIRWSERAGCLLAHVCTYDANIRWTELETTGAAIEKRADPSEAHLAAARQLLEALAGEFQPEVFVDDYQQRLAAAVEAAAEGRVLAPIEEKPAAPVGDILDALKASLAETQGKPIPKRKPGEKPGRLTKKEIAEKNPKAPARVRSASARPRTKKVA